jgi:hypothetical protein
MDTLYDINLDLRIIHHQSSARFIIVHDQQHYNVVNKAVVDAHQQAQLYEYFCYNGTVVDYEATSHDMCRTVATPMLVSSRHGIHSRRSVSSWRTMHYHIEVAFNVKLHQDLLLTIAEHHGHVDMQQQLEETKIVAAVVKYDHVDQKMSASAQCHLELGFSSFKIKIMLDSSTHDHAMHACKLRL